MASDNTENKNIEEMSKKENGPQNPYGLPPPLVAPGIEFNGTIIPQQPMVPDVLGHVKSLIAMEVKEDDFFVLAFPKCGTHWIWEVTQMLLNQNTQYEKRTKENVMMETTPISTLQQEKSPRIMNSHFFMCHLPSDIVPKRAKIIHLVRNPKDTVVSCYHHMRQPFPGFEFWDYIRAYMDNALFLPHQFDFLRQISKFEKDHPDHPIMHLHFEDMKKNPVKVIKELSEFLNVPASDAFAEKVATACSFDKMKKADETKEMPAFLKQVMQQLNMKKFSMYRKGIIGDWKNTFTVAQNEAFEDFIRRETEKGVDFKFTYE